MRRIRAIVLYASGAASETLSYQTGWPVHFQRHPRFDVLAVDVLDRRPLARAARRAAFRLARFDLVVLLHSIFSNVQTLVGSLLDEVHALPQPKAFFIGNEYKLMPEKMRFAEDVGVGLLVTMNHDERAKALYRERLRCGVASIPSGGLDTALFAPRTPPEQRPIDIGYRAHDAPIYLGHAERREIAEWFLEHAPRAGLRLDVSLNDSARLPPARWAAFLGSCRGQLGTEAGGDFFELTDETRLAAIAYLEEHPNAGVGDIRERFYEGRTPLAPGRMISGRQVEAAGTKTAQILFEGTYSGYFEPDVHYIPLRKDFADAEDALAKFRDPATRARVADAAHEVAVTELTYERLIDRFAEHVRDLL